MTTQSIAASPSAPSKSTPVWVGDLVGGVSSAIVALPLALAFAVASGVAPKAGLYTAIVAGIVGALCGGAPLMITGPTGAMAVVLIGIVGQYGLANVWIAGLMAGVIQILLGLSRLGRLAVMLPLPVISGFTAGIGIMIFIGQIGNALGLAPAAVRGGAVSQLYQAALQLGHTNLAALGLTLGVVVVMELWQRYNRTLIPPALVALVLATGVASIFHLDVPRIGAMPHGLPMPVVPSFHLGMIRALIHPALALAALGSITSLLSASAADRLVVGTHHDPDRELIGQGLVNLAVPFFGGIPATGAIARTTVSIRAGARTRVSGVVHGLTILLGLLAFAPLASAIPQAVLAGILLVVSARMIDWGQIRLITRSTKSDCAVLALTGFTTVAFDLVLAVEVGLGAAALLFIRRMADLHLVKHPEVPLACGLSPTIASEIGVYDLDRPLFFGDAYRFAEMVLTDPNRRAVVLCMGSVTTMDVTAAMALDEIVEGLERRGVALAICGVPTGVHRMLERVGVLSNLAAIPEYARPEDAVAALAQRLGAERQTAA